MLFRPQLREVGYAWACGLCYLHEVALCILNRKFSLALDNASRDCC
jgi:hypothetical protein